MKPVSLQNFFYTLSFAVLLSQLYGCASLDNKPAIKAVAPQTIIPEASRKAAQEAIQLQGHPYVYGGETPQEGFDCSGLVHYVYNKHGVKLPRDTWSLANQLPSVQIEHRQPGDLLFFNTTERDFSHVGIYVGDDHFVHAPSQRTGKVMVSSLHQPYWRERFNAVRRPQPHSHHHSH
jgi:cell wall-associated NlpC family hydrolase